MEGARGIGVGELVMTAASTAAPGKNRFTPFSSIQTAAWVAAIRPSRHTASVNRASSS